MEYARERYLIQHRDSRRYIRGAIGPQERLELTDKAWDAWAWKRAEDALYDLENNRYMPEDREHYRIVKTIDTREVTEDVQ